MKSVVDYLIENKTYDLTTEQYNFIANLKEQLNKLRLEKRRINAVIRKLENNLEHLDNSFDSEINELKEFFPNANFEEISKIQEFHTNLQSVLRSEIKKQTTNPPVWSGGFVVFGIGILGLGILCLRRRVV